MDASSEGAGRRGDVPREARVLYIDTNQYDAY
jgi:hypothetical protein